VVVTDSVVEAVDSSAVGTATVEVDDAKVAGSVVDVDVEGESGEVDSLAGVVVEVEVSSFVETLDN
jgi:hypothetical protein